jgi:hypothetical protein
MTKRFNRPVSATLAFVLMAGSFTACTYGTYNDAVARYYGNQPPPPPPPSPPPPAAFGPNFSEIQAHVFTPDCATSTCHSGANPPAGLNLEAANGYTQLVGMASSQDAGLQRVAPGNPGISYLIHKLEGAATISGGQMPPSGALPQAEIDVISQWISDGAIDDRAPANTPIRVNSISPMPGAVLVASPTQVVVGFDRDPDPSTVNPTTFILEASGGDGTFGDNNEVQITAAQISVPMANPMSAVFDIPAASPLANETYRVRLLGMGASFIMDMDGNALDGEYAGVLPSGNGTAGGDFEIQFVVDVPSEFDLIQANIFTPSCASCHGGANPPAELNLSDADISYAQLVNIFSSQQATVLRVEPLSPDTSYLIQKLEGAMGITGNQMPPGGALPQGTINTVRRWITDGAAR